MHSVHVLWYDSNDNVWHQALKNSNGLRRQPRTKAEFGGLPTRLRRQYDVFLPHYHHLHAHRIGIS